MLSDSGLHPRRRVGTLSTQRIPPRTLTLARVLASQKLRPLPGAHQNRPFLNQIPPSRTELSTQLLLPPPNGSYRVGHRADSGPVAASE